MSEGVSSIINISLSGVTVHPLCGFVKTCVFDLRVVICLISVIVIGWYVAFFLNHSEDFIVNGRIRENKSAVCACETGCLNELNSISLIHFHS